MDKRLTSVAACVVAGGNTYSFDTPVYKMTLQVELENYKLRDVIGKLKTRRI
jgi:hypothetical protein